MMEFVIPKCTVKGCQSWRHGDRCAKDGMLISVAVRFAANLHPAELCEARHQINVYRLEGLLEE